MVLARLPNRTQQNRWWVPEMSSLNENQLAAATVAPGLVETGLSKRMPPLWLMGTANATYGFYGGFIGISLPQLLEKQHVPGARIASLTALVFSPLFWIFLLSPILDVHFTRRTYTVALAGIAAVALTVGLLNSENLTVLEVSLMTGSAAAFLSSSALGAWLSSLVESSDETRLSSWFNVAVMTGAGVMAVVAGAVMRNLPPSLAAALLGGMIFLPTFILGFIPATPTDRRLARESFARFFAEIFTLLKRRDILVALAIFIAPTGAFGLTNVLGGLGEDYHASPSLVSLVGGAGCGVAGLLGSLAYVPLAKRVALRPLYLLIGLGGHLFTVLVLLLPYSPSTFAIALFGECLVQSLAFTGAFAIQFETVGRNSALAATTFCVMGSATNFSLTYMMALDGRAYGAGGLAGMFVADAAIGAAACVLLGLLLFAVTRHGSEPKAAVQFKTP
jgi:PAT family beta-lactamase induction signal transducer AmpG